MRRTQARWEFYARGEAGAGCADYVECRSSLIIGAAAYDNAVASLGVFAKIGRGIGHGILEIAATAVGSRAWFELTSRIRHGESGLFTIAELTGSGSAIPPTQRSFRRSAPATVVQPDSKQHHGNGLLRAGDDHRLWRGFHRRGPAGCSGPGKKQRNRERRTLTLDTRGARERGLICRLVIHTMAVVPSDHRCVPSRRSNTACNRG